MSEHKLPEGLDWRAFTPDDSPRTPIETLADPELQNLSTPKLVEGDPAFDFDLPVADFGDGTERETGRRFQLQVEAAAKPVALIFGSYT